MENTTILSFQHCCQSDGNILCFSLPDICPLCGRSLSAEPLATPPVRYPAILQSSSSCPFSIVIRPTNGTFIQDYKHGDNLHAAVTDSRGFLCQFDERGIGYDDTTVWEQSMVVQLIDRSDIHLRDIWDERLSQITQQPQWTPNRYVETRHNCFDFVVAFLNFVRYNHWKRGLDAPMTRKFLVDEHVLPATSKAARSIAIMKKIRTDGYLVQMGT